MAQLKTPGVYVQELSLLPASVAQVATAVPAFIGFTEKADDGRSNALKNIPTEISSMAEYHAYFGGPPAVQVEKLDLDVNLNVREVEFETKLYLYDSLRLYFASGGGRCYVISVGTFRDGQNMERAPFDAGLAALAKEDEPTLILFPDAVSLDAEDLHGLQAAALKQCADLKDRFVICDLKHEDKLAAAADTFREAIGMNHLSYGAAYGPHLRTRLDHKLTYRNIQGKLSFNGQTANLADLAGADATGDEKALETLNKLKDAIADVDRLATLQRDKDVGDQLAKGLTDGFNELLNDANVAILTARAQPGDDASINAARAATIELLTHLYDRLNDFIDNLGAATTTLEQQTLVDHVLSLIANHLRDRMEEFNGFVVGAKTMIGPDTDDEFPETFKNRFQASGWGAGAESVFRDPLPAVTEGYEAIDGLDGDALRTAKSKNLAILVGKASQVFAHVHAAILDVYDQAALLEAKFDDAIVERLPLLRNILSAAKKADTVMPPSGAIAGLYASIDSSSGVHTAPANRSLSGEVLAPVEKITDVEQEALNVHETGKSINVIRSFIGKGTLVWGARTLDGNSNEWRYVNVRRFFMMVEESTKKATARFVFDKNTKSTWVKVKAMIENFLRLQFEAGALMGSVPEQAYFVKVGVPETMSELDRLEGRMIVEIGMAVSRPAEFVILRFSHKLPT